MLSLRPPGLEFRFLCLEDSVISIISNHPQEVFLAQFSLYGHKGGLKPDSFYFVSRSCSQLDSVIRQYKVQVSGSIYEQELYKVLDMSYEE